MIDLPWFMFVLVVVVTLVVGIWAGGMIEGMAQLRRDNKKYKERI